MVGPLKRLLLVLLLAAAACQRALDMPAGVVQVYLHSLGRDPLRALALTTSEFQRRHGLHTATSAEVAAWERRLEHAGPAEPPAVEAPAPRTDDERRIAWLALQIKPAYIDLAARLQPALLEQRSLDARHAVVTVEIRGAAVPPFRQVFELVQEAPGDWLIDRVEQRGVVEGNLAAALVANPTEETRRRLAASLGVAPD